MYKIQSAQACSAISTAKVTGPTSVEQGSTQQFTITWTGSAPAGTTYHIDLYRDVDYYKSYTGVASPSVIAILIDAADWTVGGHGLFANVWYQCSDGSTPSTGIGAGFGVTVTAPGGGGGCSAISSALVSGPSSVAQGSTQTFNVSWTGSGPAGTTYQIDIYTNDGWVKSFTGITGSPAPVAITFDAARWSIGQHGIFANVFYRCSDGSTPSTGIGAGFGVTITTGTGCTPGVSPCSPTCLTGTCPAGYVCSSTGTCVSTGGGGLPTCDPFTCPTDKNYCVIGTCIPKNYVIYGAVGFGAIFLLSIIKK